MIPLEGMMIKGIRRPWMLSHDVHETDQDVINGDGVG